MPGADSKADTRQDPSQAGGQQARPGDESRHARHPADAFMQTAMESIKAMVDVNTILGTPVEAADGTVIIPVSRVSFGFVAGGSEFEANGGGGGPGGSYPFGGGTGAGVSLSPVAFLVVGREEVRLLPVSEQALYDRLLDLLPRVADSLQQWFGPDGRSGRGGAAVRQGTKGEAAGARAEPGRQGAASGGRGGPAEGDGGPSLTLRFE